MRKVILYIATSIDGFIARIDGSIDWLENPDYELENESFGYYDLMNSIDTTLMGNKTYQQVLAFEGPFPYPDTTNYVFTKTLKKEKDQYAEFVSGDIVEFVEKLKQDPGKDIWLIGGGEINSLLLYAYLIDEIIITLIPITLGEGIPLFNKGGELDTHFSLKDCKYYKNGFVMITYLKN